MDIFSDGLDEDEVTVHFVPHSHMDAGWLKTYDRYYNDEVKIIFRSVFNKLETNEEYTYTVGDIAFFRRYWDEFAYKDEEREIIR